MVEVSKPKKEKALTIKARKVNRLNIKWKNVKLLKNYADEF